MTLSVCNITIEAAVKAWVGQVSDALGEGGLDLLVSNAGILTSDPLDVLPLDAKEAQHDEEDQTSVAPCPNG